VTIGVPVGVVLVLVAHEYQRTLSPSTKEGERKWFSGSGSIDHSPNLLNFRNPFQAPIRPSLTSYSWQCRRFSSGYIISISSAATREAVAAKMVTTNK
jgi:hypothetical protein